MKTDYTITTEYHLAVCHQDRLDWLALYASTMKANPSLETPEMVRLHNTISNLEVEWSYAYAEARRSYAAGEPLIRTVCKIATRILFVLLLVGIGVGVMLK